ncbi:hypothetical protein BGZ96_008967 [Linnemannia gamsii]|uniref:Uncharacterized protein n=1 Tax=Linnemannia gamsii TaxID=64522 RepID=A0ABQ7JXE1_9FUNG|nr:hypothetical protein BGZ96_008967 [Linnemannia gamsii]
MAIVAALGSFVSVLFILYTVRHQALDGLLDQYTSSPPSSDSNININNTQQPPAPIVSAPKSKWDPHQKYLVYLPFEGISNQFYSFQNAATMAKRLNRTLVVPPITSNRHDHLGTNQPWSHYMDLEHMASHSGIKIVEWHDIKTIDSESRQAMEGGSRVNFPEPWKARSERFPCQIIRNYGHDYFVGEEDSIGADFAYQHLLDLVPIPVPGFGLTDTVAYVQDILDANQNSTENVICFSFTFTAQFQRNKNRWDIGWEEAGKYLRFLPRFASYVEDLIAFRFRLLGKARIIHPRPPLDLGTSILDKGDSSESFLSRKPDFPEYIAIHLRRGDIEAKCVNQPKSDCIIPLSEYKGHVDAILATIPKGKTPPNVVLVSDTQSAEEKATIDSYGWYRLDHIVDENLVDASKVLGPFSPALIDSAVLTGRGARWVIGSRRSTMSWLAAMRIATWNNLTIVYPKQTAQEEAQEVETGFNPSSAPLSVAGGGRSSRGRFTEPSHLSSSNNNSNRNNKRRHDSSIDDGEEEEGDYVFTWDRHEHHYFEMAGPSYK